MSVVKQYDPLAQRAPSLSMLVGKGHLGERSLLKAEATSFKDQQKNVRFRSPASALQNCFGTSESMVEIELPTKNAGVSVLQDLTLEMVVTNSSGTSAQLTPTPWWITRIETEVDGNNIETLYPENIYNWIVQSSTSEEVGTYALAYNMSTTLGTTSATLANGASQYYYLPMWMSFSVISALPIFLVNSNIRYRIYFNVQSQVLTSASLASSGVTVSNCKLFYAGPQFSQAEEKYVGSLLKDKPFYGRAIFPMRLISDRGSVTSGNQVDTNLSSISGSMAQMTFLTRAANPSAEELYTPIATTNSTIFDQSGIPIWTADLRNEYLRYVLNQYLRPQTIDSLNIAQQVYPFCDEIMDVFKYGKHTGMYYMTSLEVYRYTAGATSSQQLVVVPLRYATVCLKPNGTIEYYQL